ncbi:MAG: hypothetical protein M1831_000075 [Alyxoria varia]|nr:MAG: hypothetical protein M1831_000075 [Alyxoria varia]
MATANPRSRGKVPLKPAQNKDEMDTCRICRGEGTQDEPLFHPCKCSGSIMFVHQDCLMEWLSHSQKKHCELCKTAFRFTKLYHPHMPKTLPTGVFIRKAIGHVLRSMTRWGRAIAVGLVWLVWLPWTMRFVWWGLFWTADIDWAKNMISSELSSNLSMTSLSSAYSTVPPTSSRRTSVFRNFTIPTVLPSHDASRYRGIFMSAWKWLLPTSLSSMPTTEPRGTSHAFNGTLLDIDRTERNTLLSNVPYLKPPTRNAAFNNFLIDVLEGQVITLMLVAAFVLVLLIREWVVQQQPMANVAQGNDADDESDGGTEDQDEEEQGSDGESSHGPQTTTPDDTDGDSEGLENELAPISEHLQILAGKMENGHEDIKAFHEYIESSKPEVESGMTEDNAPVLNNGARLMLEAFQTQLSLVESIQRANRPMDPADIEAAIEKLNLFRRATEYMPESPYTKLEQINFYIVNELKGSMPGRRKHHQSIDVSNDGLSGKSEIEEINANDNSLPSEDEQPSTERREHVFDANQQSSFQFTQSSVAAEIHDSIQELECSIQAKISTAASPNAEREVDSENSSDSWQKIPRDICDNDDANGVKEHTRSRVGRARESPQSVPHMVVEESQPSTEIQQGSGEDQTTQSSSMLNASDADGTETGSDADDNPAGSMVANPNGSRRSSLPSEVSFPVDISTDPTDVDSDDRPEQPGIELDSTSGSNATHTGEEPQTSDGNGSTGPGGVLQSIIDWLWGDVTAAPTQTHNAQEVEHVVQNIGQEAPFVPFANAQPNRNQGNGHNQQPQDVGGAFAPFGPNPNDAEAIEDLEDMEGVLELIGMQGPITGLFTNALFASVVISSTIATAIWLPFLLGKCVLVFIAHPREMMILPIQGVSLAVNFLIDSCILSSTMLMHVLLASVVPRMFRSMASTSALNNALGAVDQTFGASRSRIQATMYSLVERTAFQYPARLFDAHIALLTISERISSLIGTAVHASSRFVHSSWDISTVISVAKSSTTTLMHHAKASSVSLWEACTNISSHGWTISFEQVNPGVALEFTEDGWTTPDRVIAILLGFTFFGSLCAIYYTYFAPLATSRQGHKIEGVVMDVLQQTGGILKVVLIISIEMLVFPLYCGILLDMAMLPLFGQATFGTRIIFAIESPWTSAFVHWFVGTCYMFHFALFVSMCRKILRRGVLYFIRDPDDPHFHPVRDVLERSVVSQLRKIGSSALIYGALVIVCMGSVVWLLAYGIAGVFPLRWANSTGFLGFPVDLVLYTTLKPLVLRHLTPSEGLQKLYGWWFRACARFLKLSNFLFGDDQEDARIGKASDDDENDEESARKASGKFVRVPASDQVRIPRGRTAFVEVDEPANVSDTSFGSVSSSSEPQNSDYTTVYIPNWFRLRIAIFIVGLWVLTAGAGFSLTILPLLLGRSIFVRLPGDLWANDIYAFTIGLCMVGGAVYCVSKSQEIKARLAHSASKPSVNFSRFLEAGRLFRREISMITLRAASNLYVYSVLSIIIPALFALILELYVLNPMHAGLTSDKPPKDAQADRNSPYHQVPLLQDWTLGIQYLRIALKLTRFNGPESRPARALRAVVRRGYTNPDARLATRYFFLPIGVLAFVALVFPAPVGWAAGHWLYDKNDTKGRALALQMAYPVLLALMLGVWRLIKVVEMLGRWRAKIRDEVYLIGERLHNFGEDGASRTTAEDKMFVREREARREREEVLRRREDPSVLVDEPVEGSSEQKGVSSGMDHVNVKFENTSVPLESLIGGESGAQDIPMDARPDEGFSGQ